MPDYAMRSDLDALRQQIQSDPGAGGFPFMRCVPQIVQRSYLAVGIPATFDWATAWTFSGGGGLLYPDRQIEAQVVVAASNNSGAHRWVQTELRLNAEVIATANIGIQDTVTYEGDLTYRLIALGSNTAQMLAGNARAIANENLANPWTLSLHVRWRDAMGIDFEIDPDNLTEPVTDTFYFRYHSLVTLT